MAEIPKLNELKGTERILTSIGNKLNDLAESTGKWTQGLMDAGDKAGDLANQLDRKLAVYIDTGKGSQQIASLSKELTELGKNTGLGKKAFESFGEGVDKLTKKMLSLQVSILGVGISSLIESIQKVYDLQERWAKVTGEMNMQMGKLSPNMSQFRKGASQAEGTIRGLTDSMGEGTKIFEAFATSYGKMDTKKSGLFVAELARGFNLGGEAAGKLSRILDNVGDSIGTKAQHDQAEYFKTITLQADKAGIPLNAFAKDIAENSSLVAQFGKIGQKTFVGTAAYLKKFNMGLKEMDQFMSKFDTFDDAASSVAKLNTAFGTSMNSLNMMLEQNPAKRFETIRQAMLSQGKTFNTLTRNEIQLLKQQTGMDEQALSAMLDKKNAGMSYEKFLAQKDKKEKARQSAEAMMQKQLRATATTMFAMGQAMDKITVSIGNAIKPFLQMLGLAKRGGGDFTSFGDVMKTITGRVAGFFDGLARNPEWINFMKKAAGYVQQLASAIGDFFSPGKIDKSIEKIIVWFKRFEMAIGALVLTWGALKVDKFVTAIGKISATKDKLKDGAKAAKDAMAKISQPQIETPTIAKKTKRAGGIAAAGVAEQTRKVPVDKPLSAIQQAKAMNKMSVAAEKAQLANIGQTKKSLAEITTATTKSQVTSTEQVKKMILAKTGETAQPGPERGIDVPGPKSTFYKGEITPPAPKKQGFFSRMFGRESKENLVAPTRSNVNEKSLVAPPVSSPSISETVTSSSQKQGLLSRGRGKFNDAAKGSAVGGVTGALTGAAIGAGVGEAISPLLEKMGASQKSTAGTVGAAGVGALGMMIAGPLGAALGGVIGQTFGDLGSSLYDQFKTVTAAEKELNGATAELEAAQKKAAKSAEMSSNVDEMSRLTKEVADSKWKKENSILFELGKKSMIQDKKGLGLGLNLNDMSIEEKATLTDRIKQINDMNMGTEKTTSAFLTLQTGGKLTAKELEEISKRSQDLQMTMHSLETETQKTIDAQKVKESMDDSFMKLRQKMILSADEQDVQRKKEILDNSSKTQIQLDEKDLAKDSEKQKMFDELKAQHQREGVHTNKQMLLEEVGAKLTKQLQDKAKADYDTAQAKKLKDQAASETLEMKHQNNLYDIALKNQIMQGDEYKQFRQGEGAKLDPEKAFAGFINKGKPAGKEGGPISTAELEKHLPGMATGGIVRTKQAIMVAENGPEAVIPLKAFSHGMDLGGAGQGSGPVNYAEQRTGKNGNNGNSVTKIVAGDVFLDGKMVGRHLVRSIMNDGRG